jgi:hypothetical protein
VERTTHRRKHLSPCLQRDTADIRQTAATNLTQQILNFTTSAVLDACDKIDGVKDRLIEDPLKCNFDISSLACSSNSGSSQDSSGEIKCLTPSQISAFNSIYAGPKNAGTNAPLYPGFSYGSEIELLLQEGLLADAFSIPILQNLVYDNLNYNSDTFNWASDVKTLDQKAGRHIDEIAPDLSGFKSSGGKMLTTQGWADPFNAATWPIEHLHQLESAMGGAEAVSEFYKLFMVPGGGHCGAAQYYPSVPAVYDVVPALVDWVEKGKPPKAIKSSGAPDGSDRTRKLCVWPETAVYEGKGNVDSWRSYSCQ